MPPTDGCLEVAKRLQHCFKARTSLHNPRKRTAIKGRPPTGSASAIEQARARTCAHVCTRLADQRSYLKTPTSPLTIPSAKSEGPRAPMINARGLRFDKCVQAGSRSLDQIATIRSLPEERSPATRLQSTSKPGANHTIPRS